MNLRGRASDLVAVAVATLFGATSLTYPFGRDQGLFYYIGREWLGRGAIPYRDAVEHKPPGIFVLHGLLIRIFGEQMWSIRLVDLFLVVAFGASAAALVRDPDESPRPGLLGAATVSAAVFYYGFFPFWDLAQCEIVCGVLAFAALAVVWRGQSNRPRAQILSGLMCGAALVVKPPVAWMVVLVGLLVARIELVDPAPRRFVRLAWAWGRYVAAAMAVLALTAGYFAAHGALGELSFWLVDVNRYYVAHERGVSGFAEVLERTRDTLRYFEPYTGVALLLSVLACASAFARGDRVRVRRFGAALALFAAAYAGEAMQLKFYRYHAVLFVGPVAYLSALLFLELRERVSTWSTERATAIFAGTVLALFPLSTSSSDIWWPEQTTTVRYLAGGIDREEFTRIFAIPVLSFSYHDCELVGLWLREHSSPDDNIAVRGFEPEIYAVAHRRYHGRFFWTNFITDPRRSLRHDAWLAEEERALREDPPRFAVTIMEHGEVVGSDWYEPHGYVERARFGDLRILERTKLPEAPP